MFVDLISKEPKRSKMKSNLKNIGRNKSHDPNMVLEIDNLHELIVSFKKEPKLKTNKSFIGIKNEFSEFKIQSDLPNEKVITEDYLITIVKRFKKSQETYFEGYFEDNDSEIISN